MPTQASLHAAPASSASSTSPAARIRDGRTSPATIAIFIVLLVGGIFYSVFNLHGDVTAPARSRTTGCRGSCSAWRC